MGANYMKLKLNLIIVLKNVLTTENRINWGQLETLQNRQDKKGKTVVSFMGVGVKHFRNIITFPLF
jgi:hypothetical protein